jgi:hypothetical protein
MPGVQTEGREGLPTYNMSEGYGYQMTLHLIIMLAIYAASNFIIFLRRHQYGAELRGEEI